MLVSVVEKESFEPGLLFVIWCEPGGSPPSLLLPSRGTIDGQEVVACTVNEDVYGPALFGTVGVGLVLWILGLVKLGRVLRRSDQIAGWAGWAFAIAAPVFAIAGFSLEPLQPVAGSC